MSDMLEEMRDVRTRMQSLIERGKASRAARDEAMVMAQSDGWALDEIADVFCMSRERVRLILKHREQQP